MPDENAVDVIKVIPENEKPDPLSVPMGDVFKDEMAKLEGKEPPSAKKAKASPKETEKAPEKPAKEPEAKKGDNTPSKVEKPATKPSSALDAALGDKVEAKKDEPEAEPEVLKEFPKDAKKPNWERAREVMGKQAAEKAALLVEKQQLEKELADTKAQTGKLDPEIEKRLAENSELRDAITAVNLELLPEFRKEFKTDRDALVKDASSKLSAYGGDSQALVDALGMPEGRRRDEAIEQAFGEDMTEVGKTKIRNIIAQIEEKDEKAARLRSDSQNSFEAYQARVAERSAKAQQEKAALRDSEIDKTLQSLSEMSPIFKKVDPSVPGAEEWNKGIDIAIDNAKKLLGPNATLPDATKAAAWKERGPFIEKLLLETRAELKAAQKQLSEYDTSQPEAKGIDGPKKTGEEAKLEKTPGQIYNETMARQQGNPIDA